MWDKEEKNVGKARMKNYFVSSFTAGLYCLCHYACGGKLAQSLYMSVCGNHRLL